MWGQILLPIILATLLFLGITALTIRATFITGGNPSRWAAIATMWLTLPAMFGGLIALAVLGAAIFLIAYVTALIPQYSYKAQRFFYRLEYGTKRAGTMVRRPVLFLQGALSFIKAGIGSAWERLR